MDIRRLQYFLAIAEEGQITKAAKRLHMAQPPLSQQLKLLEIELGVQLIERTDRRNIKLTDAGQLLRNRAGEILTLVDQTVTELKELRRGLPKTLYVGISPTWDTPFLPDQISNFRKHYPDINFQLHEGEPDRMEELLGHKDIEIAITRFPADLKTYATLGLADEGFVAAFTPTPKDTLPTNYVRLGELADKPFIIHRKHNSLVKYCQQIGLESNIRCQHSDIRSMLAWANTGLGIAIVPKSAINLIADHTLIVKEIIDPPLRTTPTALIWLGTHSLSPSARYFIDQFTKPANI